MNPPSAQETEPQGERVLIVVTLAGGGIQAAAWSAEVLTGLQAALGRDFTQSVALISSVSGGSVGAFFYLEGLDPETGELVDLDAVRKASSTSSLEETAWGLAYPDFLGAISPLPLGDRRDRAWAMERAWLRAAPFRPASDTTNTPTRLSDWSIGARAGVVPAVVLNATIVEDAQQAWLSNLDLAVFDDLAGIRPETSDPSLEQHYGGRFLDMSAVTAARLSATFPWVTPVARARLDGIRAFYLADGGYFDNYGTVAAVDWLRVLFLDGATESDAATSGELSEDIERWRAVRDNISKILFIDVRAFPGKQSPSSSPRAGDDQLEGLAYATWAPVKTLLGVRNTTQALRSTLEIELLERIPELRDRIEQIVLQPEYDPNREAPPLSWYLSPSDKRQICLDWLAQRDVVRDIEKYFPNPPRAWPTIDSCQERLGW